MECENQLIAEMKTHRRSYIQEKRDFLYFFRSCQVSFYQTPSTRDVLSAIIFFSRISSSFNRFFVTVFVCCGLGYSVKDSETVKKSLVQGDYESFTFIVVEVNWMI